jgi:tight adherence protein B
MRPITLLILFTLSLLATYLAKISYQARKIAINRAQAWPEVLDLLISSLQSGASISESLSNLATVGPQSVRKEFDKFSKSLIVGEKFEVAVNNLKEEFADPITDQLFETLYFATKFGSKNTIKVLREISEYASADLALRAEINTRFGWIKNSANLAALAPWLLFIILRTQENARLAYLQPTGQLLMIFGVIATLFAYLWMSRIAKLPKAKRLFTMQITTK